MTKVDKLDKLKEYKVYLTDEEKRHLANVALKNSTFGESVLAGVVHQIFDGFWTVRSTLQLPSETQ